MNKRFMTQTSLPNLYSKPFFTFQTSQGSIEANKADFKNILNPKQQQDAYQFIINENLSYWIPIAKFKNTKLLQPFNSQIEWDLSLLYEIYSSVDFILKAIQFCATGYAQVNEQRELLPFLLGCVLLNVDFPMNQLSQFITQNQDYLLALNDPSEILDVEYFFYKCSIDPQLSDFLQSPIATKTIEFEQRLSAQNQYYFLSAMDFSQVSNKMSRFPRELFQENILGHIAEKTLVQQQNGCVSFQSIQQFHFIVNQAYQERDLPQKEKEQCIQEDFFSKYNEIKQFITEEDQFLCGQIYPLDCSEVMSIFNKKEQEIKQLQARESIYEQMFAVQKIEAILQEQLQGMQQQFYDDCKLKDNIEQSVNYEISNLKSM